MKSAELVDYISDALREGRSFRSITFELVNAGWHSADVEESIALVKQMRTATVEHPTLPDEKKPLSAFVGPISNPLPSLERETRPLTLQKRRIQSAIPASRIFTSFLKKEMEKGEMPTSPQKALSDVPLVGIMDAMAPTQGIEETTPVIEKTEKDILQGAIEKILNPPLPPVPEAPEAGYQSGPSRPVGYFIPTVRYLADEAVLKQDVQMIASQMGRAAFVVPTKVTISMWKREEVMQKG